MTKIYKYCFDKWWRPLIFFGFATLVFGATEFTQNQILIDFSFYLLLFGLVGLIISTVYQLTRRKWFYAFLSILTFGLGIIGFFLLVIVQFWTSQLMPDHYADNLIIPDNIEIYKPKGDGWNIRPDSILEVDREKIDFELYKSFQPGLYEYDLWIGKINSGAVYLKVYEITQNDRLSKDRLTERSTIEFIIRLTRLKGSERRTFLLFLKVILGNRMLQDLKFGINPKMVKKEN